MDEKRNYKSEKNWLSFYVLVTWIWSLATATLVLYMFVFYYSQTLPVLNVYYYGILAGITGAVWGVGVDEAYSFSVWARYGNNFHKKYNWKDENKDITHWVQAYQTKKSFLDNLRYWQKRFLISLGAVIVAWVIIIAYHMY